MVKDPTLWDVVVVGAGAAGLMTSIHCARGGLKVLLLDGQEKIGAKILMSGGTRCNLTNHEITEKDYNSNSSKVVRNILRAFSTKKTIDFFYSIGVKTVVDGRGQYYPETHTGKTVLDCLIKSLNKSGVTLYGGQKVKQVVFADCNFNVSAKDLFHAKNVVLTTGGLSFPKTGSDGVGYSLAKHFGHTLLPRFPALTPLLTDDKDWISISGTSVPSKLTLMVDGKQNVQFENDLLFTHFGFSGLGVLNISRHWEANKSKNCRLSVNFLPNQNLDKFREHFEKYSQKNPKRQLRTFLMEVFPERFADVICQKLNIDQSLRLNQCKREVRESLLKILFEYTLPVKDVYGYGKAEVTAGGLDFKEVHEQTLESKKRPGLYFAGEILDVDGRIGGFNFQWAWASGVVVSLGILRKKV